MFSMGDGTAYFYVDVGEGGLAVLIIVTLVAYFIGNISPSIIMAKARGIDIKKEGSGNAGTTNALRVMGKKAGAITLVVDILKGTVAVMTGSVFAGTTGAMWCAVAVFCGHVWPIVFRFRGGKGVATAFGALLGLNPLMAVIVLAIVVIMVLVTKRMSVGSITGAICFPFIAFFMEREFVSYGAVLAIIVLIKHRANIGRLMRGEEPIMSIFEKKDKDDDDDREEVK